MKKILKSKVAFLILFLFTIQITFGQSSAAIQKYQAGRTYPSGTLIVHNSEIWKSTAEVSGEPGIDILWSNYVVPPEGNVSLDSINSMYINNSGEILSEVGEFTYIDVDTLIGNYIQAPNNLDINSLATLSEDESRLKVTFNGETKDWLLGQAFGVVFSFGFDPILGVPIQSFIVSTTDLDTSFNVYYDPDNPGLAVSSIRDPSGLLIPDGISAPILADFGVPVNTLSSGDNVIDAFTTEGGFTFNFLDQAKVSQFLSGQLYIVSGISDMGLSFTGEIYSSGVRGNLALTDENKLYVETFESGRDFIDDAGAIPTTGDVIVHGLENYLSNKAGFVITGSDPAMDQTIADDGSIVNVSRSAFTALNRDGEYFGRRRDSIQNTLFNKSSTDNFYSLDFSYFQGFYRGEDGTRYNFLAIKDVDKPISEGPFADGGLLSTTSLDSVQEVMTRKFGADGFGNILFGEANSINGDMNLLNGRQNEIGRDYRKQGVPATPGDFILGSHNIGFGADLTMRTDYSLVIGDNIFLDFGDPSGVNDNQRSAAQHQLVLGEDITSKAEFTLLMGKDIDIASSGLVEQHITAIGKGLQTTDKSNITMFGSYNDDSTTADGDFVIANGTSNSNRSNSLIIKNSGVLNAPSLDVAEILDNQDLTTKQYVDERGVLESDLSIRSDDESRVSVTYEGVTSDWIKTDNLINGDMSIGLPDEQGLPNLSLVFSTGDDVPFPVNIYYNPNNSNQAIIPINDQLGILSGAPGLYYFFVNAPKPINDIEDEYTINLGGFGQDAFEQIAILLPGAYNYDIENPEPPVLDAFTSGNLYIPTGSIIATVGGPEKSYEVSPYFSGKDGFLEITDDGKLAVSMMPDSLLTSVSDKPISFRQVQEWSSDRFLRTNQSLEFVGPQQSLYAIIQANGDTINTSLNIVTSGLYSDVNVKFAKNEIEQSLYSSETSGYALDLGWINIDQFRNSEGDLLNTDLQTGNRILITLEENPDVTGTVWEGVADFYPLSEAQAFLDRPIGYRGEGGVMLGENNTVFGNFNLTIGKNIKAGTRPQNTSKWIRTNYSQTIGEDITNFGQHSIAIGRDIVLDSLVSDYTTSTLFYPDSPSSYQYGFGENIYSKANHTLLIGRDIFVDGVRSDEHQFIYGMGEGIDVDKKKHQYIFGRYNDDSTSENSFVFANGVDDSNRSNAFVISNDGSISAPSLDISEITESKELVTKEYVDRRESHEVVSSITLNDSFSDDTIIVNSSGVVLTLPNTGLNENFFIKIYVLPGADVTIQGSGGVVFNSGSILTGTANEELEIQRVDLGGTDTFVVVK